MRVFVRFVSEDGTIKQELLDIVQLKDRTCEINLKETLMTVVEKANLQLSKLTAISTDRGPAMLGYEKGLVGLCIVFQNYGRFTVLFIRSTWFLNKLNIMKSVIEIINFIRRHALKRQLKHLVDELEDLPSHLLLHCNEMAFKR